MVFKVKCELFGDLHTIDRIGSTLCGLCPLTPISTLIGCPSFSPRFFYYQMWIGIISITIYLQVSVEWLGHGGDFLSLVRSFSASSH